MSMSTENLVVLAKIVTAVESGGQVYGCGRYDDVTMPYTNSKLEHTVTLGVGQFYGSEAHALVNMIYTVYPDVFAKLDTASPSIKSMIGKDWVSLKWSPNVSQVKVLKAIISSTEGKACQDTLLAEQLAKYVKECETLYPKAGEKAQMMFAEIRHLGGLNPTKRIFNRLKAYDLDVIMTALKADQADTSSDNQVGDKKYWSRHEKCYEFINKYYVENNSAASGTAASANNSAASGTAASTNGSAASVSTGTTKAEMVKKGLAVAKAEEGYLEKASNKNLDSKTANAGSNNYTKYWRDIKPSYQGSQWCLLWAHWVLWKAFGKTTACKLLRETASQFPLTYCPDLGNIGTKHNCLYTKPEPMDVVLFYKNRGSEGGWRFGHAGLVISSTSTTVTTIEGNTSGGSTVVANGGGVFIKTYKLSDLHSKTRFYRPDWAAVAGANDSAASSTTASANDSAASSSGSYPFIGEVTADKLNVRTGPGTNYSKSKYYPILAKGNRVEVIRKEGDWYFIKITNAIVKAKAGKDSIYDYASAKHIKRV